MVTRNTEINFIKITLQIKSFKNPANPVTNNYKKTTKLYFMVLHESEGTLERLFMLLVLENNLIVIIKYY